MAPVLIIYQNLTSGVQEINTRLIIIFYKTLFEIHTAKPTVTVNYKVIERS